MNKTYSYHILTQLKDSGFSVEKDIRENQWQLKDNGETLMQSRSLGELCKKASQTFNLDWR